LNPSSSIKNATGNEYMIEPIIIPDSPTILKLNIDDIEPFDPNKLINPNPCDIEGINIGNINNIFNNPLCFIFVLLIAYANKKAINIDRIVALEVAKTELVKAVLKASDANKSEKVSHLTFISIVNNG
jgi:hypothetical protein